MSSRYFILVTLILSSVIASPAAKQHVRAQKSKPSPAQQSPTPAPAQQPPPEPPPTPEHGPASPPEVTFRNGQLTIIARNSTLGDVLNAVRSKTGASVEMPPASTERVVGQFGPGAPRDVMAQLLNGSHYDYVLLGAAADPGALKTIVLTVRATGPEPVQQANNPGSGYNGGVQTAPPVDQDQQDQPPDEVNNDVQPEPPTQVEQEEPQGDQPPPQANPTGSPNVKTPEQLLRELQQQQQQQQQQQNQPPQQ